MSIASINFNETNNYSTRETEKSNYLTTAKIKQIALYSFALLLALAIVGAYFFAPPSYSLLPTPLSFGILGLAYSANQIKDFKNPQKMKIYKKQTEAMPLPKIHKYFGLKTALKNNLFTVEELQNKFNKEIQELDFCTVANNYPLEELLKLKIASPEHIELLQNLKAKENQARKTLKKSVIGPQSRIRFNHAVHPLEEQYSAYKLTQKDV